MIFIVKCDNCSRVHSIEVPVDEVDSYEREMGPEISYYGSADKVCECGNKITISVEGSEYPMGDEIQYHDISIKGAQEIG